MRKFLISITVAASALAVAVPAAAQYAPQPYNGYGRGYEGRGFGQRLTERVNRVQRQIRDLEDRRVLSGREARYLEGEARDLQRSVYRDSGNGIQPGEAQRIEERLRRLEYRVQREASDNNNRPGYRRY
jgi:adenylosuccinate synthase